MVEDLRSLKEAIINWTWVKMCLPFARALSDSRE